MDWRTRKRCLSWYSVRKSRAFCWNPRGVVVNQKGEVTVSMKSRSRARISEAAKVLHAPRKGFPGSLKRLDVKGDRTHD